MRFYEIDETVLNVPFIFLDDTEDFLLCQVYVCLSISRVDGVLNTYVVNYHTGEEKVITGFNSLYCGGKICFLNLPKKFAD